MESKLNRQMIFMTTLKNFVDQENRLPAKRDEFRGIDTMRWLQHHPETILIPELKTLVCTNTNTRERIVRTNHIKEVTKFIKTYERIPRSNSENREERLLRSKCLAYPGVKEDPYIRGKLMEYFIPKLLTLDDSCKICYKWIVSNRRWPSQNSEDDLETRIHYWVKDHMDDLSKRYKSFLKLENTLRPVRRKREPRINKVEFFKTWCEKYKDYPRYKYKDDPNFTRVVSYLAATYWLKTTVKLTEEEKSEIKAIAEYYGWTYKPKPWCGKGLRKLKRRSSNRSVLIYDRYKELQNEVGSKKIYKEISEEFNINISIVKRIIISSKKANMSYNDKHILSKDAFTRSAIELVGISNIKSVLDPFAGVKSFYQNENRMLSKFNLGTEIITNDLHFKGHTYQIDAKILLDKLVNEGKTFDLVDLDPFNQPLYYISLINLINMTDKLLILTIGGMDRNKTKRTIKSIWDIEFTSDCNALELMVAKIESTGKTFCNKSVKMIDYRKYGGTYRIAFKIN